MNTISKKRPATKKQDEAQRQRFIDTAREVGADEDEDAFKKKLERIAKAKPKDEKKD